MTPTDPPTGLHTGDILAGKYRVERVLGAGGMGVVVAAHHIQLQQLVAVKLLLPEALDSPEAVGRFLREARAAVRITGEHVARVTDVGELETGAPFMVMEYLDGVDLAVWVKQRGALPVEQAVDFVLQACEAIADAHVLGIVHRDIKPANLFCVQRSGEPCIKVLDFGISKIVTPGAPGHDLTKTSAVLGSPFYMSPEQMQSAKSVDARTDVWSLGVVLFELISGRVPFQADAVTELAIKIMMEPAPQLRDVRADAPDGLGRVIARCLEKSRERRFATVGELASALREFASRFGQASADRVLGTLRQAGQAGAVLPPSTESPVSPMAETGPSGTSTAGTWDGAAPAKSRTGIKGWVVAVVATVLAVPLLAVAVLRPRGGEPKAPATATAPPSAAPSSPASAASVTAMATATATAMATATATASASASASAPAPAPLPRPTSRPAAAATGAKPSCDPPYYFTANGTRVFKKECL